MKRMLWSSTLIAGSIALTACADVAEPTLEPSFSSGSGPVLEQASGAGHFRESNAKRTFTFHAQKHADGTATGSFHIVTENGKVDGTISCLRVLGERAWVGGTTDAGVRVAFSVLDDGEGAGSADRISFVFSNRGCTGAGRLPQFAIDAGNIQVKGSAAQITDLYSHDFETAAGSEWSVSRRSTAPNGQTFLGDFSEFTSHGMTLTLNALPEHSYLRLSFDFYAIRTLDGSNTTFGLDLFTFGESTTGFSFPTTFSGFGGVQAFPGTYPENSVNGVTVASGVRTLGYVFNPPTGPQPQDATYPVELTIEHTGGSAQFTFSASALQAFRNALGVNTDESWGIDNVRVQAIR